MILRLLKSKAYVVIYMLLILIYAKLFYKRKIICNKMINKKGGTG